MTLDDATDLVRHSLILVLMISAPMLIVGLVVGVIVSVVQALTQIQEQTLTFIPKITAMIIAAAVLMPWIGLRLMEYSQTMFAAGHAP